MKYMGSKKRMLQNGMGNLIVNTAQNASRIVDLFCGASSVAWYAAQKTSIPVQAIDMQYYAVILARSVVGRDYPLDFKKLERTWLFKTKSSLAKSRFYNRAKVLEESTKNQEISELVHKSRALCMKYTLESGPIWIAYGGYYFSPKQALTFDTLLMQLPKDEPERSVCLAATISAASMCAAAPGHTAQPFRPTTTAGPHIREAWDRDPITYCMKALKDICPRYAQTCGSAQIGDAVKYANRLKPSDLVIIDPPYSNVQYSRFYHVLETLARGKCSPVNGAGRYPPISERPQSDFSKKSQSINALYTLLEKLSIAGVTAIFTFPAGESSNGLSGNIVIELAKKFFSVEEETIGGVFSTLGGNNSHRAPRKLSNELLLLFTPQR